MVTACMPRMGSINNPEIPPPRYSQRPQRQALFATDDDFRYYLDNLAEWKANLGCRIYAYCSMTNHVHLIIDPGDDTEALAKL